MFTNFVTKFMHSQYIQGPLFVILLQTKPIILKFWNWIHKDISFSNMFIFVTSNASRSMYTVLYCCVALHIVVSGPARCWYRGLARLFVILHSWPQLQRLLSFPGIQASLLQAYMIRNLFAILGKKWNQVSTICTEKCLDKLLKRTCREN